VGGERRKKQLPPATRCAAGSMSAGRFFGGAFLGGRPRCAAGRLFGGPPNGAHQKSATGPRNGGPFALPAGCLGGGQAQHKRPAAQRNPPKNALRCRPLVWGAAPVGRAKNRGLKGGLGLQKRAKKGALPYNIKPEIGCASFYVCCTYYGAALRRIFKTSSRFWSD
jgi:hypothetical protein